MANNDDSHAMAYSETHNRLSFEMASKSKSINAIITEWPSR